MYRVYSLFFVISLNKSKNLRYVFYSVVFYLGHQFRCVFIVFCSFTSVLVFDDKKRKNVLKKLPKTNRTVTFAKRGDVDGDGINRCCCHRVVCASIVSSSQKHGIRSRPDYLFINYLLQYYHTKYVLFRRDNGNKYFVSLRGVVLFLYFTPATSCLAVRPTFSSIMFSVIRSVSSHTHFLQHRTFLPR